jgi:hypothetical protein
MVGPMKHDRKNPVGNRPGSNQKECGNLSANPDIVRQYEDLCRLRKKVRKLLEKVRGSRPDNRD